MCFAGGGLMMRLNFQSIALALLLVQELPLPAQSPQVDGGKSSSETAVADEKLFSAVVATNASDASAWSALGYAQYVVKRYGEALSNYQTALKLAPDNSDYHYSAGCCYYGMHKYSEAAEEFLLCAKTAPTNATAHHWAGICLKYSGRLDAAVSEFRTSLNLDPNRNDSCDYAASCLLQEGRNKDVCDFLMARFRVHPGDALGDSSLAYALANLGRYDDAVDYYRKALALEPGEVDTWLGLGGVEFRARRANLAEAAFRQACGIAPQNSKAHCMLGMALTLQLRFDESKLELERALELSPGDDEAKPTLFLDYLCLSQYEKALDIYPACFSVGIIVLLSVSALGVTVLLRKSFKLGEVGAPGIVFSIAWLLLYPEIQVTGIFLAGLARPSSEMWNFAAGAIFGAAPVLVALSFAFRRQPWGGPFTMPSSLPWKLVALGAAGLVLVLLINGVYEMGYSVLTGHPLAQARNLLLLKGMMHSNPVLTVALIVLIGPVVEETLFRGLLYGSLEKKLRRWSIPVTAVIFGAYHLDPAYFVPITVIGFLLGWARWKSGSIWLPAILHTTINGLSTCLFWQDLVGGF